MTRRAHDPTALTNRERAALDLLVQTGCNKLIAREMGVAPSTVEIHLASAREKLGAPNRVLQALQWSEFRRST